MGKKAEYLIKWEGWSEETNTWERASAIHPALVASFEGVLPPPTQLPAASVPVLPHRGAGCARARLSAADQKRGGLPHAISMVCGDVTVHLTESRTEACMPRLKILFFVMTMDKNGHVVWPTDFGNKKKAQLREQARQLLK